MRRLIIIALSLVALVALPASSALADPCDAACQAYSVGGVTQQLNGTSTGTPVSSTSNSNAAVANDGAGNGNTSSATVKGGSLPFTGLDAALLAAGGLILVGAGLAVRATITARREAA